MRVLWLTFIPSPYRLRFFEELGKECRLTVLFERASSKTRKHNWDDFRFDGYSAKILPGITIGGYDRLCPGVCKYLNREYDHIVISNPTSPTGILAAAILRAKGIPYMVESDGAFPTGRKNGIRMMLKRFVMKSAQVCFSTADLHDRYYQECGVRQENLRRYPFTSLSKADLETAAKLAEAGKSCLREALGISEKRMVLSVGQFVHRKGFDVLLEAVSRIPGEVGFYFVGDVPPAQYLDYVQQHGLNNVHFVGFQKKERILQYYAAADIFVLPTREDIWGLVINEAMACGLPVITTDRCIAGLELIRNGYNGYIVPVDDVATLAEKTDELLSDPENCAEMGANSLEVISNYTFERMCEVHMDVFGQGE